MQTHIGKIRAFVGLVSDSKSSGDRGNTVMCFTQFTALKTIIIAGRSIARPERNWRADQLKQRHLKVDSLVNRDWDIIKHAPVLEELSFCWLNLVELPEAFQSWLPCSLKAITLTSKTPHLLTLSGRS